MKSKKSSMVYKTIESYTVRVFWVIQKIRKLWILVLYREAMIHELELLVTAAGRTQTCLKQQQLMLQSESQCDTQNDLTMGLAQVLAIRNSSENAGSLKPSPWPGHNLKCWIAGICSVGVLGEAGVWQGIQMADSISSLPTCKVVFQYLTTNTTTLLHIGPMESNVKRACLFL